MRSAKYEQHFCSSPVAFSPNLKSIVPPLQFFFSTSSILDRTNEQHGDGQLIEFIFCRVKLSVNFSHRARSLFINNYKLQLAKQKNIVNM